jgi:DNA-binding IclR family transcriptional regulator
VKTAPSVDRAVAILTVVSSEPSRGVTLSEITRRTGFPKSTCHAVIASLVQAHWLLRHPVGPTYRLGPGFIALADAAGRNFPALPFAETALAAVCARRAAVGFVTAHAGDEIAVLARTGDPAPLSVSVAVGQRIPFSPPLASVFLAWTPPADLGSPVAALPPDSRRRYVATLAAIRKRGYSVALQSQVGPQLSQALAAEAAQGRTNAQRFSRLLEQLDKEEYQVVSLRRTTSYSVNHISAPVFDANGVVAVAITLVGLPSRLTGAEVEVLGRDLRRAADQATVEALGRMPIDQSVRSARARSQTTDGRPSEVKVEAAG